MLHEILALSFRKIINFLSLRHAEGSGHSGGLLLQFVIMQWRLVSHTSSLLLM